MSSFARDSRRKVDFAAEAQWPDGSCAQVVISELSYEGCQLISPHEFVRGETVKFVVPGRGEILAQVRWVRGGKAGAQFLTGETAREARRVRIGV